jgi:hypothetical protein
LISLIKINPLWIALTGETRHRLTQRNCFHR